MDGNVLSLTACSESRQVCRDGAEIPFFSDILLSSDHNVQQRYLENGSSTHRHFITKLMLITARNFPTTQCLHSYKFTQTVLSSGTVAVCCVGRHFLNVVRMRTRSLVPKQRPQLLVWERASAHVKSRLEQAGTSPSVVAKAYQVGRCIQLFTYSYAKKQSTRSFSIARSVMKLPEYGCQFSYEQPLGQRSISNTIDWLPLVFV